MVGPIVVTGANGDIGDAVGRILRETWPDVRLIGADADGRQDPGIRTFSVMAELPRAHEETYVGALRSLVAEHSAQIVIPTTEFELERLARLQTEVAGLPLLMNAPWVIETFLDKKQTAEWMQEIGVPTPKTNELSEAQWTGEQLVVKPRKGRGGRGVELVTSKMRLAAIQCEAGYGAADLIVQSYMGRLEDEFTCAIMRADASTTRTLTMRRRLQGGMTSFVRVERIEALESALQDIADHLPDRSVINVQLRFCHGVPYIFEVNPRISGTAMLRHRLGFTDVLWWIGAFLGEPLPAYREPHEGASVYRVYSEHLVP